MFIPGELFQHSLMFGGKGGANPRVEHLKSAPLFSLLRKFVNYGQIKFNKIDPRSNILEQIRPKLDG